MASRIFKPGNRLFATAAILMIVVAMLHTIGHFAPAPVDDTALHAVMAAMRSYQFDLGLGMRPNFMDVFQSLSLTMSISLLFLGLQNLITLAFAGENSKLVQRLTLLNLIGVGALAILNAIYRLPPPLISFVVVEVILLLSLLLNRNTAARR